MHSSMPPRVDPLPCRRWLIASPEQVNLSVMAVKGASPEALAAATADVDNRMMLVDRARQAGRTTSPEEHATLINWRLG